MALYTGLREPPPTGKTYVRYRRLRRRCRGKRTWTVSRADWWSWRKPGVRGHGLDVSRVVGVETGTEISGSTCMGVSGNVMKQCRELWRNVKSERSGGGLGWGEARLGAPGVDLFAATTRLGSPTR